MFKRFRLGTLFGFPIELSSSFLLLLVVVFLWMGGLAGVLSVSIAFASVLLHELGHALVARHLAVPVPRIELNFFGGAAHMGGIPRKASDEIAIAAAGPIVSFVLGGLSLALFLVTGVELFQLIGWINIIIGAFNLTPALPMDGGRILRAALSKRVGFRRATHISVSVARVFAFAIGFFGLASGNFHLALLALFLYFLSGRERFVAHVTGGYRDEPEVEVLPRDYDPRLPRAYVRFVRWDPR